METIKCPACGEQIAADSKKCNLCNEEIEKQCPCCKEWITSDAKRCKHCGTWLNKFVQEQFEGPKAPPAEAEEGGDGSFNIFVHIESVLVFGGFGALLGYDWLPICIAIFVVFVLLSFQFFRIIYSILISGVWGLIGLSIAPLLMDESDFEIEMRMMTDNFGDYWWIAIIAFVVSLLLHGSYMSSSK